MNIVQLSAFDRRGGAAVAAMRLHQGLLATGVDSDLLVQFKDGDAPRVYGPQGKWSKAMALFRDTFEVLPLLRYRQRRGPVFSSNWIPSLIARRVAPYSPDLVHLHWVHAGMLSPAALGQFRRPLVWTMHDMWPFTGGCHYAGDCGGYRLQCGHCPQLGSTHHKDLSRWTLARKRRSWDGLTIVPVAPSQWLANCAATSQLFGDRDVRVIPNGVDLSIWRPVDKQQAREMLGLPGGPLLLFTAARGIGSPYKGGDALIRALRELHAGGRHFTLLLMGNSTVPANIRSEFPVLPLGKLHDDICKVLAYSAADITVHNAEQDNLPNTVVESLACGTPVVSTSVGGLPEMIDDARNGLLVPAGDSAAMCRALAWCLDSPDRSAMSRAAREKAEQSYDLNKSAEAYRSLYAKLVREDE